ncbi:hypothetical protein Y1Q_0019845 [Alligator mississippiensis]|uniref:Uncharacterized protein n=1 Tax=Alligator mississippiensis TaxID=8496 RepID=A0A151PFK6_ALLMI|nr:hypothetical protein Y1Q_0019845 [Alligator mississippiensis]
MESSSLQASCPQKWTPALLFASECAKDQRSYSCRGCFWLISLSAKLFRAATVRISAQSLICLFVLLPFPHKSLLRDTLWLHPTRICSSSPSVSTSSWFYPCRPVIADDAIGWLQLDKDVADEPRGFLSPFQLSVAPAVALIAPDGHHLPFSKLSGCLLDS